MGAVQSRDGSLPSRKKVLAVVMLGAPGSGKGTQAHQISRRFVIPEISTGEMLREAVKKHTKLGKQAQQMMESGQLVTDGLVCGIVQDRLAEPDCSRGFILDGFPRTLEQARFLGDLLKRKGWGRERVLNLRVDQESLIRRLTGRRMCPVCGAIYNIYLAPPKQPGFCDRECAALIQRNDDTEQVIRRRMMDYERQTRPLIEFYRSKGQLYDVDGNMDPAGVTESIFSVLSAA